MKKRTTPCAIAIVALALMAMGAGPETAPSASPESASLPATQPSETRVSADDPATQPLVQSKDIFQEATGPAGAAGSAGSAATRPSGAAGATAAASDPKSSAGPEHSERTARSERSGAAGSGASRPLAGAAPAHPSWSSYKVIIDRNIFIRGARVPSLFGDERRNRRNDDRSSTQPSATSPAAWVLTGTALEAGDRVAFLENSVTSETRRVHAGEVVAGVRLVAVEPTAAVLQGSGRNLHITLGTQLDGAPAPLSMPTTAPSGDTASATAGTPGSATAGSPAPSSAEAALIERMKARRAQEVSK